MSTEKFVNFSKQVHEFDIRGDGEVHTKVRIEEKEEKTEGIYNH